MLCYCKLTDISTLDSLAILYRHILEDILEIIENRKSNNNNRLELPLNQGRFRSHDKYSYLITTLENLNYKTDIHLAELYEDDILVITW